MKEFLSNFTNLLVVNFYDFFLQFFLPFLFVVDRALVVLRQPMSITEHIATFALHS